MNSRYDVEILGNQFMQLWSLASPKSAKRASKLRTQGGDAVEVQRPSAGRVPSLSGVSLFLILPSTDWMSNQVYRRSADLNVHLILKIPSQKHLE